MSSGMIQVVMAPVSVTSYVNWQSGNSIGHYGDALGFSAGMVLVR